MEHGNQNSSRAQAEVYDKKTKYDSEDLFLSLSVCFLDSWHTFRPGKVLWGVVPEVVVATEAEYSGGGLLSIGIGIMLSGL